MNARDMTFTVLGALVAIGVLGAGEISEESKGVRGVLQVNNASETDLVITAGDSKYQWPVDVVKPSSGKVTRIVTFWSPDQVHEGGQYILGLEAAGRKTVLSLAKGQVETRSIGNLRILPNGDVEILFFGSGLPEPIEPPSRQEILDIGAPNRSQ